MKFAKLSALFAPVPLFVAGCGSPADPGSGDDALAGAPSIAVTVTLEAAAADGFPAPLWDPETGSIDPEVADHWRENWDLSHIVARDWAEIGPALAGKLHFAVGRTDNYYLEQAIYLMEERLRGLSDPEPKATFQYGVKGRHSWIGHSSKEPERQMTYAEFIGGYIADKAPAGADLESWAY